MVSKSTHWYGLGTSPRNPGPALNAAKRSLVQGAALPLAEALALEKSLFDELTACSDALRSAITD
jgi:hypothetical protein